MLNYSQSTLEIGEPVLTEKLELHVIILFLIIIHHMKHFCHMFFIARVNIKLYQLFISP